jgi:pyruvate kinase
MRRAKIAGTLGPSCEDPKVLERAVRAGLDLARINFSHGSESDHRRQAAVVRKVSGRTGRPVALMADLQGPRFRIGTLPGGRLELADGKMIVLEAGRRRSRPERVPVAYSALAQDVASGDTILLDDGKLVLRVTSVEGREVRCRVVRGGVLTDHKGLNIPGRELSAPSLTRKDRRDLDLAVELDADWLALSFVRRAEDVKKVRRLLARADSEVRIMAKIERPEAVDDLDRILEVSDGLLVARGDLGVELPPEKVPSLQKLMIAMANAAGKPVMTATQMLESMRSSTRPTRAEASDVANAVLDGSGSLLLTAETAVGEHPVEAIAMMGRIIEEAERTGVGYRPPVPPGPMPTAEAICHAAAQTAAEVGARLIAVFTVSGYSARSIARFRPQAPIMAFTPHDEVRRRMAVYWGVESRSTPNMKTAEQLLRHLERALAEERLARKGDRVVMVAGHPVGVSGTTNLMTVLEV